MFRNKGMQDQPGSMGSQRYLPWEQGRASLSSIPENMGTCFSAGGALSTSCTQIHLQQPSQSKIPAQFAAFHVYFHPQIYLGMQQCMWNKAAIPREKGVSLLYSKLLQSKDNGRILIKDCSYCSSNQLWIIIFLHLVSISSRISHLTVVRKPVCMEFACCRI